MIVLTARDFHLQELLKREGLTYGFESSSGSHIFLTPTENQLIVSDFSPLPSPTKLKAKLKRVKYIIPDNNGLIEIVGIVDINSRLVIPVAANLGSDDTGQKVIYYGEIENRGKILIIPLNLTELLKHRGSKPKKFWTRTLRFPYEDVAITDRGGIRRLISAYIKQFAQTANLPFIKLSCVPGAFMSMFGFRVDTDFSSPSLIEKAVRLAEKVQMRWTWFVTTEDSLLRLKSIIKIIAAHDVQLHCNHHLVYPDLHRNKMNLLKGKEILNQIGIIPVGAAAPFGVWNENLQRALEELGFKYSSEFGYSYDDIPGRPLVNGKLSSVLQIPVHPISLGRLAEMKLSRKDIFEYYRQIIDLQCARGEPCFLYDHPKWIVHYYDVLKDVLEYGVERCGSWSTFTDYYRWWEIRESVSYEIKIEEEGFNLIVKGECPDATYLTVEHDKHISFVPLKTQWIDLKELKWIEVPSFNKSDGRKLYTRCYDLRMAINERIWKFIKKIKTRKRGML
ncbi:MAG: hypothetical protein ACUVUD_06635 [bacterium]